VMVMDGMEIQMKLLIVLEVDGNKVFLKEKIVMIIMLILQITVENVKTQTFNASLGKFLMEIVIVSSI